MPYITSGEAFQGYAHAIIVGLYTDMITASAVKKDNNTAVLVASVTEPMGSVIGEISPVDNVIFNMEKAIMALPEETRTKGTVVIVTVGPGIGVCEYLTVVGKREARDHKITAEEMDAILASGNTEIGNDRVCKNYPQHFSIDGFSVPDPIGVNGGEVSAGVVRVSCAGAFEKECDSKLTALGFHYAGMIDMRYAAMHAHYFYERSPRALLLFVFEQEAQIAIVRENAVHAIGTAGSGYGILYADIAEVFSVGILEAKEIVRAYHKQELNENTKAAVEQVMVAAGKKTIEKTQEAIIKIDSANIIPGNIHVVCAHAHPEITAQFASGEWFKELPMERNASISVLSEELSEGFATPFDFMSVDFLLRHTS